MLITEDALLREPNLWIPGKKPVGPVRPARHKFSQLYLMNGLADKNITGEGSGSAVIGSPSLSQGGILTSNGNKWKTADPSNPIELRAASTHVLHYKRTGSHYGNGARILCRQTGGSWSDVTIFQIARTTSTEITLATNNAAGRDLHAMAVPASLWTVNTEHVVVFRFAGAYASGTVTVFIDGDLIGTATWTNMSASLTFQDGFVLGDITETTESYERYLGAVFYSYQVINSALSNSECLGLSKDPYQFLIPA